MRSKNDLSWARSLCWPHVWKTNELGIQFEPSCLGSKLQLLSHPSSLSAKTKTEPFSFSSSLPMSRTSSEKPPPRPPPYQGRSGRLTSQEASVTGTKEARERFRSGSPSRANTSSCRSRGGSARPPRGRSISVTVCQYAAPKDKKTETLKVKQRPLSLSLTPASSTNSVASSSQDTEEFWGRYRRGPAPISIVQLFRRAVGLGQSQVGRGGEEEPTYAEIYRGGDTGGTLPVRGRGRRRPPPPPPL